MVSHTLGASAAPYSYPKSVLPLKKPRARPVILHWPSKEKGSFLYQLEVTFVTVVRPGESGSRTQCQDAPSMPCTVVALTA